ncbi:glycoside hydrolase family 13 protein [Cellulomonas hominis]|uniref:glycoside hydrolase family 13 protein n=1 Tax=Cellulomonas hominis TaxID=156981 RepID=UPI001B9D53AA|nr:glycoside hydrolase family 13 protein [Cellulomonas hominis]VTR77109.1 Maltodextrin glucosidase [Cellulomonas hominis]
MTPGAHHDGSALHVPAGTPALGDVVPVRVRVPAGGPAPEVWLRVVEDGEPRVHPARADGGDEHERWFTADVPVTNPVTSYRFLLAGADGEQVWLNGSGVHARDVPDAADFRLSVHAPGPDWARDAVVYQVFPDRFARSTGRHEGPPDGPLPDWALPAAWSDEPIGGGPGTGTQLYGGDLGGIEARLDHLQRLGVDTLYLTPFFPGRSNHRYDASTFDHVDPLLGGDEAMASLSRALHGRGMRLVGDLTTNHTGDAHDWFRRAVADPDAPERSFYYWTDEEPGYVGWLGHASLPKLNHHAPVLAERLIEGPGSVAGRYLDEPFGMDGWRIDVANMTGRQGADDLTHDVARRLRRAVVERRPDAVLIAEHFHDAAADLLAGGWHGTMNYSAFTRPVWTWLADPSADVRYVELPVRVPRRTGAAAVAAMREFGAAVPWSVTTHQWNLLGSHDTARIRTLTGSADLVEVGAGLLLTYPGTPVVFAGDEGGAVGTNGEHARVPMPWDAVDAGGGPGWHARTFEVYRALIALRRSSRALREGGLRWLLAEDDAVAYLRETPDERVLVLAARAPWRGAVLPGHLLAPGARPENLYGGAALPVGPAGLELPGDGPGVQVWRLA